jgi:hypothetical protein
MQYELEIVQLVREPSSFETDEVNGTSDKNSNYVYIKMMYRYISILVLFEIFMLKIGLKPTQNC